MLSVKLNEIDGIAMLEPDGELSEADFKAAAKVIDPYIEKTGKLQGIIIYTKSFPGWESFSALITHLKFIKEHHKKVSRIAIVTDSTIGGFVEHVAKHFVRAKINSFPFSEIEKAKQWLISGENQ
jgi:hypothetical protein